MLSVSTKNIYSLVNIKRKVPFSYKQVLSCKALKYLADIHINFNDRRLELLSIRKKRNNRNDRIENKLLEREYFRDREIKICGIAESKLVKNPISTNGKLYLVNFGSDTAPTWSDVVETQINLREIINLKQSELIVDDESDVDVAIRENPVIICGRDLEENEINMNIDGTTFSAAFFDNGLYLFHNAKILATNGPTPHIILSYIENYYEAKLWNEFLNYTEEELSLEAGSIKAIVNLDNTLPEFEQKHIYEELSEHLA